MPMKVSIGLSKKVGLPDYGSLGASCNVEVELDGALLQTDVEKFQQHVKRAYQACAQAVNEELARSHGPSTNGNGAPPANGQSANGNGHPTSNGNGHATTNGNSQNTNGNGHAATNGKSNGQRRSATVSQTRAIYAIARNQGINLGELMERYGVRKPDELDIKTASQVIDSLKNSGEGRAT